MAHRLLNIYNSKKIAEKSLSCLIEITLLILQPMSSGAMFNKLFVEVNFLPRQNTTNDEL